MALTGGVIVVGSIALMALSYGSKWRFGQRHEPRWSWAIGSGRFKLWFADSRYFGPKDWWPNMWYRGLDAASIRWDFSFEHNSEVGMTICAIPLWSTALLGAAVAVKAGYPIIRQRRRVRLGLCMSCGYDRRGASGLVCPECGWTDQAGGKT
jgi:hypothetical protein